MHFGIPGMSEKANSEKALELNGSKCSKEAFELCGNAQVQLFVVNLGYYDNLGRRILTSIGDIICILY